MHFFLRPFLRYIPYLVPYSSFRSSIACFKTTDYILAFFMRNVNMIFNFNKKNSSKSIEHVVSFFKLVLRVLKTVLKNQKNLIFKNCFKHLERKCFNVLGQKQFCSHKVKNGCKNLKRFSFKPLKPFCLSSEQDLIRYFSKFKKILVDFS